MNRIEEGTYGVVFRAKERRTGELLNKHCDIARLLKLSHSLQTKS